MKKKIKTLQLSLVLVVIFWVCILNTQIYNTQQENNMGGMNTKDESYLKNPHISKSWWDNFTFIHITEANWSIAASYEWCRGDGSSSNPYIIENITIDASSSPTGSGIYIQDSKNVYFVIRNCTVNNAPDKADQGGIKLENVNNGTIIENYCNDNEKYGILLLGDSGNCENNTVLENTANNNLVGIVLQENCNHNNISGNLVNGNANAGIVLDLSDYNNLTGNTANNNYMGIYLQDSDRNNITENTANYNTFGITLGVSVDSSDYNWVINNTLIGNHIAIEEYDGVGNVIKGNTIIPPSSGGSGGDDDNDNNNNKEASIPGYDLLLIIGLISIMTIVLLIPIEKNKFK
ncbi:MAG: nitrous oxide reductase family maturation protein NosD [Promethearchaeota archaeon]